MYNSLVWYRVTIVNECPGKTLESSHINVQAKLLRPYLAVLLLKVVSPFGHVSSYQ